MTSASESAVNLRTPCGRSFTRAITLQDQHRLFGDAVVRGRTKYRGVHFMKPPMDVSIYLQLLHKARPASVIEIGSKRGGSALWFADMIAASGLEPHVISIDLNPPKLEDHRLTFMRGDALKLEDVLTDEVLNSLPRPWLVSEDCAHVYETTKAVLDFFADRLRPNEYIVVEDGVVSEVESRVAQINGGPNRAVAEFLASHPSFEVDTELCDLFGFNVTSNPNGYLRRRES